MNFKRLFGIVLLLLAVLSLNFCVTAWADDEKEMIGTYEKYYRGDMNDDDDYTFRDALSIMNIVAKIDADNTKADMNLDGTVTVEDAIIMFDIAYNKSGTYGFYTYAEPAEENVILVDNKAYENGDSVYRSLNDAVQFVNDNAPTDESGRITILMAPGVYREQVTLTAPYVTIKPIDPEAGEVKLTYFLGCGNSYYGIASNVSATTSPAFIIEKSANYFETYDMTYENSYNIYLVEEELELVQPISYDRLYERFKQNDATINQTQALAIRCGADRVVFERCTILGRQDTIQFNKGGARAYLKDCYIEGTVDFIYADGTCVFDSCQINSPYNSGYITAACTPIEQKYGFLFYNCELTREAKNGKSAPSDGAYALGRTWGQDAMVMFWNCKMDDHIRKDSDRWQDMGSCKASEARYYEVGSMDLNGNPLDLESFVDKDRETVLTQEDMTGTGEYAAWRWLWGDDQWNPAGFEVPAQ